MCSQQGIKQDVDLMPDGLGVGFHVDTFDHADQVSFG
jgi:hypothetical protein